MAATRTLSREETIGLAVAFVAHVALVAALVHQVSDKPTLLPEPERIEVSLAEDVGLVSAAPNPSREADAAVAPVLADTPAPEPLPAPKPVPTPAPRAEVRPTPTPVVRPQQSSTRPQPRATPTARPTQAAAPPRSGGGSRIGADFLQGAGSSTGQSTPAATFGAAEAAALNSAIARQLKPHWSAPPGVDVELLVTLVRFRLNEDGSLDGRPTCVQQSGETDSNRAQKGLHCERAIRAVQLAAPFRLPAEFYDKWKLVTSRFDRRL